MKPRRYDHTVPDRREDGNDFSLAGRRRVAAPRDLQPDEVHRARLTVARYAVEGAAPLLAALGIGPRVEVQVAGSVSAS